MSEDVRTMDHHDGVRRHRIGHRSLDLHYVLVKPGNPPRTGTEGRTLRNATDHKGQWAKKQRRANRRAALRRIGAKTQLGRGVRQREEALKAAKERELARRG